MFDESVMLMFLITQAGSKSPNLKDRSPTHILTQPVFTSAEADHLQFRGRFKETVEGIKRQTKTLYAMRLQLLYISVTFAMLPQ